MTAVVDGDGFSAFPAMCVYRLRATPGRVFAEELRRPLGVSTPVAQTIAERLCSPQSPIEAFRAANESDVSLFLFGKDEEDVGAAMMRLFGGRPSITGAGDVADALAGLVDAETVATIRGAMVATVTHSTLLLPRIFSLCIAEQQAQHVHGQAQAIELCKWTDAHWPHLWGSAHTALPVAASTFGLPEYHADMCDSLALDDRWWCDCSRLGSIDQCSYRPRISQGGRKESAVATAHVGVLGIFRKCMGKRCQIRELIPHIRNRISNSEFLRHCVMSWIACSLFGYYMDYACCTRPQIRLDFCQMAHQGEEDVLSVVDRKWGRKVSGPGDCVIYLAVREAMAFYVAQDPGLHLMLTKRCDWQKFCHQNTYLRNQRVGLAVGTLVPAAGPISQSMHHCNLDYVAFTELLWSAMQKYMHRAMPSSSAPTVGDVEARQRGMWDAMQEHWRCEASRIDCARKSHAELICGFLKLQKVEGSTMGVYVCQLYAGSGSYGKTELHRQIKASINADTYWGTMAAIWMLRICKRLRISVLPGQCTATQLSNQRHHAADRKLICLQCPSEEAVKCSLVEGNGDVRLCSNAYARALQSNQKLKRAKNSLAKPADAAQPVYGAKGVALCSSSGACICCPKKTCPGFLKALPSSDHRFTTTLPALLGQARCAYDDLKSVDAIGRVLHFPEFSVVLCCFCLRPMLYVAVPSIKGGMPCCALCMQRDVVGGPTNRFRKCCYCLQVVDQSTEKFKKVLVCNDGDPLRPRLQWATLCGKHGHAAVHNRTWILPMSLLPFVVENKIRERELPDGSAILMEQFSANALNGSREHVALGRLYAIM